MNKEMDDKIINDIITSMKLGHHSIPIGHVKHTYGVIERRLNEFEEVQSINFTRFRVGNNIYEYQSDNYSLCLAEKPHIIADKIINRIIALMEAGQSFIPTPYDYNEIKKRFKEFKKIHFVKAERLKTGANMSQYEKEFKVKGNVYMFDFGTNSLHLVAKEPYTDVYIITTLYESNMLLVNEIKSVMGWRSRTVGWYPTLDQAEKVVISNEYDIHEDRYNYCVIEKLSPGIYPNVEQEWWFFWHYPKYLSIPKKPDIFVNCTNFSIG